MIATLMRLVLKAKLLYYSLIRPLVRKYVMRSIRDMNNLDKRIEATLDQVERYFPEDEA